MRFSLAQLMKLPMPYSFNESMDLRSDLVGLEGILDITRCDVSGKINRIDNENYKIDFTINVSLILECAVSLREVPYEINSDFSEVFSTTDDDEVFLIEGQTLDTKEAVITNILIAKPMKVYAEGEVFVDENESFSDEQEERKINPAFESLKDLL